MQIATVEVPHALHLPGEVNDPLAGQDLPGSRPAAQTSGQVEGASSVPRLQGDRLSGIEPDPDGEREGRIGDRLLQEPILGVRGCEDRLARRVEGGEGLVSAKLDHRAAVLVDHFPGNVGEARRQLGRGLVASLLREQGVAANVGDQERPDVDVFRAFGRAWERPIVVGDGASMRSTVRIGSSYLRR